MRSDGHSACDHLGGCEGVLVAAARNRNAGRPIQSNICIGVVGIRQRDRVSLRARIVFQSVRLVAEARQSTRCV